MNNIEKLKNLVNSLDSPLKNDILKIVAAVEEDSKRRQKILSMIQEALASLRLDIKYLQFDLEVTRKERDSK